MTAQLKLVNKCNARPDGSDKDQISLETFLVEAKVGLETASANFTNVKL